MFDAMVAKAQDLMVKVVTAEKSIPPLRERIKVCKDMAKQAAQGDENLEKEYAKLFSPGGKDGA